MEIKSKLYLQIIGGLIIVASIFSFFFSPNYEHFKQGFQHGLYDGKNGICSTDETITVKSNSNVNTHFDSLKTINLTSELQTVEISLKGQELYYSLPFYAHILMFIMIVTYALMLVTFIYFLGSLSKGKIFERSTYKSLNILGFSLIISPFLEYAYNSISLNAKAAVLQTANLTIVNDNLFNFCELLGGLLMIAFAIAFRLGISIKQENDLTV